MSGPPPPRLRRGLSGAPRRRLCGLRAADERAGWLAVGPRIADRNRRWLGWRCVGNVVRLVRVLRFIRIGLIGRAAAIGCDRHVGSLRKSDSSASVAHRSGDRVGRHGAAHQPCGARPRRSGASSDRADRSDCSLDHRSRSGRNRPVLGEAASRVALAEAVSLGR